MWWDKRISTLARRPWSTIVVDDAVFAVYVKERLIRTTATGASPGMLHAADLYLACACVHGNAEAHRVFAEEYSDEILAVAKRVGVDAAYLDDVKQLVLTELLAGRPGRRPGLVSYRGVGALRTWVRRVTARKARRPHAWGGHKMVAAAPEDVADRVSESPEETYFIDCYRDAAGEALTQAVAELAEPDRDLLRQRFFDQATLAQIGGALSIHPATVMRRLQNISGQIFSCARERLAQKLGLEDATDTVDSILALTRGQLHAAVATIAGPAPTDSPAAGGNPTPSETATEVAKDTEPKRSDGGDRSA